MGRTPSHHGFVGRVHELATLSRFVEGVAEGRPGAALISGPAGIGKTALVAEIQRRYDARVEFSWSVCLEEHAQSGAPAAVLEGLFPDLVPQRLPHAQGVSGHDVGDRWDELRGAGSGVPSATEIATRLRSRLSDTGNRSPTLFVIEDVQWIDYRALEILTDVIRRTPAVRCGFIFTDRVPDPASDPAIRSALRRFLRTPRVFELSVRPLDPSSSEQLFRSRCARTVIRRDELSRALRLAEGTPLFIEALADQWTSGSPQIAIGPLDATRSAVERLGPRQRKLTDLLAVAQVPMSDGQITACCPEIDVGRAVEGLDWLVERTALGLTIRHALLREAVEATIPPDRIAVLHSELLALWEAQPAPDAARCAYHAAAAGNQECSLRWSTEAGDRAAALEDWRSAAAHFETVVSAAQALDRWLDLLQAKENLAEYSSCAGRSTRSIALIQEVIAASERGDEPPRLFERLGYYLCDVGRGADGVLALTEAILRSQRSGDVMVEARARVSLGRLLALAYRFDEARAYLAEGVELAYQATDLAAAARGVAASAFAGIGSMRLSEAAIEIERAGVLSRQVGAADDYLRASILLSRVRWISGDIDGAVDVALKAYESAGAENGGRGLSAFLASSAIDALVERGRWTEIERLCNDLSEHEIGVFDRARLGMYEAMRALRQGSTAEVLSHLEPARAISAGAIEHAFRRELGAIEAEHARLQGNPTRAIDIVLRTIDDEADGRTYSWWDSLELTGILANCELMTVLPTAHERFRHANERMLASLRARMERVCRWEPVASRHLEAMRLEAEAAIGEVESGRRLVEPWRVAESAWLVSGHVDGLIRVRSRLAHGLTEAGDHSSASTVAQAALSMAEETNALCAAAAIRPLVSVRLENKGLEVIDLKDDFGITKRESEVLRLISSGATNAEIATTLFISQKTAESHVANILMKLGVKNRTSAGLIGARYGLGAT